MVVVFKIRLSWLYSKIRLYLGMFSGGSTALMVSVAGICRRSISNPSVRANDDSGDVVVDVNWYD